MIDLTVVILTFNEEMHIERALNSVASIAREVVVVDSFSTDLTTEIAERLGARVLKHPFQNYAKQFQWALDNCGATSEWVMRFDADELVEADLAQEITAQLPLLAPDVTGVNLKRKHIFMGRWIRHGGRYPLVLLRIWRRGRARIEQRWMDEHMMITEGRIVTFNGGFSDANLKDLTFFTQKHNRYATREAIDVINQRRALFPADAHLALGNTTNSAFIVRYIKEHIYNNLPFELSAAVYFVFRYFIQLGFLDGREGAIYHFLQGYWYRFLVGSKVIELERALDKSSGEDPLTLLSKLTGLTLSNGGEPF